MTELATEGRSLLKLGALLERVDAISPVSESVCRCMAAARAALDYVCTPLGDYLDQSLEGNLDVHAGVAVALRSYRVLQVMRNEQKETRER